MYTLYIIISELIFYIFHIFNNQILPNPPDYQGHVDGAISDNNPENRYRESKVDKNSDEVRIVIMRFLSAGFVRRINAGKRNTLKICLHIKITHFLLTILFKQNEYCRTKYLQIPPLRMQILGFCC